jgi:abequosyltransferase
MSKYTGRFWEVTDAMNIRLSICIPIYNCVEFVGQALDSILPQTSGDIEVIVYDGGSTDATPALMERYAKAWPNLQYHRGAQRGGIDADLVTCVGFAKGEYCWLFSGDDVMRQGAIERAFEWIKQQSDIYICKHTICSKTMVVFHEHPVLAPDQAFTANFANSNERLDWFRRAVTTEAFFSFMSSLVVRRDKWQSGTLPEAFSRSCWGHVARFFGLVNSGLIVCYVAEVWLDQRGGNDSFADKGIVNRYGIAIEGYHKMAETYFTRESEEAFHIRRVIRNEFSFSLFLHTKILCLKNPIGENRQLLDKLFKIAYCDNSTEERIAKFKYLLSPYWLLATVKFVYQPIKKIRGWSKNI